MKNNTKNKTLLERGGLMIEALAMLGLIAVVTPTMYKKSAERTMEVDDINTATTIRSYVTAAESYMATNYVPIMQEFEDAIAPGATPPAQQYKQLDDDDLEEFLPYKFKTANSLYDYNAPKVTVVRNANNLTAFLLFPAKGAGDDGLGQERTARIASLVGANGGYVRSEHNARGVGGIWSLSGDDYTSVFPDDDGAAVYSIVASTSNAVNGSTQAGDLDNPKYLQRTFECPEGANPADCQNEKWRNTMRTDLYLGGYTAEDEFSDNPSEEMHHIRNIGSLIVGAEEAGSGYNGWDGYSDMDVPGDKYGLYLTASEAYSARKHAYIEGSLMAGMKNFFVNDGHLGYGIHKKNVDGTDTPDGYNFEVYQNSSMNKSHIFQRGTFDIAHNFENDSDGTGAQLLVGAGDTYCGYLIGAYERKPESSAFNGTVLILQGGKNPSEGVGPTDGGSIILFSGAHDAFSQVAGSKIHGGKISIAMPQTDTAYAKGKVVVGTETVTEHGVEKVKDVEQKIGHIQYEYNQKFPVAIGNNTYVKGLMAADQVDTQKLRTASLSTGSEHVDDQFQWLTVDKDGVVIESTEEERTATGTEVHVDNSGVAMRFGGTSDNPKAKFQLHSDTFSDDGHGGRIQSPSGTIRDDYAITGEAKNITFKTENEGTLALQNNMVKQTISGNQINISNESYTGRDGYSNFDVNITVDGVVNLVGSNLRAGYVGSHGDKHNIFSVNTSSNFAHQSDVLPDESLSKDHNYYPEDFAIAMHGNVLFTDGQSDASADINGHTRRYMSIGQQADSDNIRYAAGVEIASKDGYSAVGKAVVIDLTKDETHPNVLNYDAYCGVNGYKYTTEDSDFSLEEGTVYIRKGAVDVVPVRPTSMEPGTYNKGAREQVGYIAAPRFVANNRDSAGNLVKVPDNISGPVYNTYNNTSDKSGRYDTYMVNPAYTSVMHDIKLTTRGGARLSDILPNFIIKGIYISTNDKDDSISDFKFRYAGDTVESIIDGNWKAPTSNTSIWASPYTGYVPKPQCPPGYISVLTFTPISMYMAQAGQLAYNSSTGAEANHYTVEEDFMTHQTVDGLSTGASIYKGAGNQAAIEKATPQFRQVEVMVDAAETGQQMEVRSHRDGFSEHDVLDVYSVSGLKVHAPKTGYTSSEPHYEGDFPYVLTVGDNPGNSMMPFVFQQNTWLKTLSIPLCNNSDGSTYKANGVKSQCELDGKYVNSWALLMGFVYLKDVYSQYLEDTNARRVSHESDNYLYWNVFPITKGSLEGTATTYCYFDRTNLKSNTFEGYSEMFAKDEYISLEDANLPTSLNKTGDPAYIKRLNDPTLKYTEEW